MEPTGYTSNAGQPQALDAGQLDAVFAALANATRRDMLMQLGHGSTSVTDIAARYDMSQPAVSKHLRVLEHAGLITRAVDQQRRPATLHPTNLAAAVAWLEQFARFWEGSLDQLDGLLASMAPGDDAGNPEQQPKQNNLRNTAHD